MTRRSLFLGMVLIGAFLTSTGAPGPERAGGDAEGRPDALVGIWRSDERYLDLKADGSFRGYDVVPAGPEAGQTRLTVGGPGKWSAAPLAGAGGGWSLVGLDAGAEVRRGRATNAILLREASSVWESTLHRVSAAVDARVAAGLTNLEAAGKSASAGDLASADRQALEALRQLRDLPEFCPLPAASAAFLLGRIRQGSGRADEAMLLYDECIRLRVAGFEAPHPQLTRARFFAGQFAKEQAGYQRSLTYFAAALDTQQEILRRTEATPGVSPDLRRSVRAETAAVYLETAGACSGFSMTSGALAFFAETARLGLLTEEPMLARIAAVGLFSHLMAREGLHDASRLLLSTASYLEQLDAQEETWSGDDVLGKLLRDARVARELAALKPPRADLASRFALRAIALAKVGDWSRAPYVPAQIVPGLIAELGLTNEAARLPAVPASLGPKAAFPVSRRALTEFLDRAAPPVDLAREFPDWDLQPARFPSGATAPAAALAELRSMTPALQAMAGRPTPEELETKIRALLAAPTAGAAVK